MLKRVFQIFIIAMCSLVVLSFLGCSATASQKIRGSAQESPESETITELNQTYEGTLLNITATDIQFVRNSLDACVVGVHLVVENVSGKSFILARSDIDTYIDDVAKIRTIEPSFGEDLPTVTIEPGKRAEGYVSVDAPEDAEVIELYYDGTLVFIFDIPPIEEIES